MFGNESCKVFSSCTVGEPTDGLMSFSASNSQTIPWLIAEGGGNLLKSAAEFNRFASAYEFSENSGMDFQYLQTTLNSAIASMEKTRGIYRQLSDLASITPYDPAIVRQLNKFNYEAFARGRGLIRVIFCEVQAFLVKGDVRGIYEEFHNRSFLLLERLYSLKKDVDAFIKPDLPTVWRLNQEYSEFKLFGQYVAEVFFTLP